MGCQAPGGSRSCLEFLPGSLSVSIHSGTGLRGVLVPLGAALENAGMPQLSSTWEGPEPEAGRGRCRLGRAQLSHSSGRKFLGALSLFRQEMSADLGLRDATAGRLILTRWVGQAEHSQS